MGAGAESQARIMSERKLTVIVFFKRLGFFINNNFLLVLVLKPRREVMRVALLDGLKDFNT